MQVTVLYRETGSGIDEVPTVRSKFDARGNADGGYNSFEFGLVRTCLGVQAPLLR